MIGLGVVLAAVFLLGCSSISQIGTLGPRNLPVYSVRDTGVLSENRTVVILDPQGNLVAATGGTVNGPGPVLTNLVGAVVMAGAIAYSARTLADGLHAMEVRAKGGVDLSGKVASPITVICQGCAVP